jgi:hypothetical protein
MHIPCFNIWNDYVVFAGSEVVVCDDPVVERVSAKVHAFECVLYPVRFTLGIRQLKKSLSTVAVAVVLVNPIQAHLVMILLP